MLNSKGPPPPMKFIEIELLRRGLNSLKILEIVFSKGSKKLLKQ